MTPIVSFLGALRTRVGSSLLSKVLTVVVLLSAALFTPLALERVWRTRALLENTQIEQAQTIARILDASIETEASLLDEVSVLATIQKTMWLEPDVLAIDINFRRQGQLVTIAADQVDRVESLASTDNDEAFETNSIVHRIIDDGDRRMLRVVTPIHIARSIVGTYQLDLTMDEVDDQIAAVKRAAFLGYAALTILFSALLMWFQRRVVLRPVTQLTEGVRAIRAGDLSRRVQSHSSDELGELATSYNRMTEDLEMSQTGLIEANARLEEEIRHRERHEAALLETQKLESLGVMAGGVAHDFNNLLTTMLAQATLASAKIQPESPVQDNLAKVVSAAERAASLTHQLLVYAGRGRLEFQPLDLNQTIRESLPLLELAVPKNITLETDLLDGLKTFDGDSQQVQQALMNLVMNGAEAADDPSGSVTIRTAELHVSAKAQSGEDSVEGTLDPGDYVSLIVTDTGGGMSSKTADRIFEPFFTTKPTGHGLGLAAVHGIVRSLHGDIQVQSAPGRGTTIRLNFPIGSRTRSADSVDPESLETEQILLQVSGTNRGKRDSNGGLFTDRSILVIDDEPNILDVISEILALQGARVIRASGGLEGLDTFKRLSTEIHLIILDLSMPDISGSETLLRLRLMDRDVPIIISSGYSDSDTAGQFIATHGVTFLPKPYRHAELIETVSTALASKAGETT